MNFLFADINGFLITADHELDRIKRVSFLLKHFPKVKKVNAIYPAIQKIPFKEKLQQLSKLRTGHALNNGELGVLLSNRKIWREICSSDLSDDTCFLILESDSWINEPLLLEKYFTKLTAKYDMFFFGSWLGNTKILRSTRKKIEDRFYFGTPFIKTISGGYGYALNKKAAAHLLKKSSRIAHPADEFKRYIQPGYLKIGAVVPEIISEKTYGSTIGDRPHTPTKEKLRMIILNCRNNVISFFR